MAVAEIELQVAIGDEEFFQRKGFNDIAHFREQCGRLSAAVVIADKVSTSKPCHFVWSNKFASFPLSPVMAEYLSRM